MTNNEILQAAQKNKGKGGEYESHIFKVANIVSVCVSLVIGFGLIVLEYFFKGTFEVGYAVIVLWTIFAHHFVEIIKVRRAFTIICGIFTLVMAIIASILYIAMW